MGDRHAGPCRSIVLLVGWLFGLSGRGSVMFRMLVMAVVLGAHGRRVAKLAQPNAITLSTAIGDAIDIPSVVTAGAGIMAVLGAGVVTLKIAPRWSLRMLGSLTRLFR